MQPSLDSLRAPGPLFTSAVVFFDTLFFTALTPLLPHYAARARRSARAAPACSRPRTRPEPLLGAIPSGIVAARFGVKPTVLVGLSIVAVCTMPSSGSAAEAWQLDLARFCQGVASAFSWTGALAWLVAASPPGRAAR